MAEYFKTYEDELDYLIDKVENDDNTKTWVDMVEDLGVSVHPDVLRKSFTGGRYGGYAVAKYFKNKQTSHLDSDEIERLESLRDEIAKERIKLGDQNRVKKQYLRDEARFETLVNCLKDGLREIEPLEIAPCLLSVNKGLTAVLQLSDWHVLKNIDNQFNVYNREICIERVNTIVRKAIEKSFIHNVTDLIIEINGDIIDGVIQVSARNGEEADVITQILFASELLANAINTLLPHYNSLKIITTFGNHGRVFADKKTGLTHENFEMLIPEYLKLRLGGKVPIIKSYGMDFTSYEINGELICVAHGQSDTISSVITNFSKMYKRVPKEIHLGHTHAYKDINDCDVIVTVNGSLVGADDYAIQLRKITKPSQNFIVYDGEDRCIYNLMAE